MTRYAWITDPHLDHVREEALEAFVSALETSEVDGFLIGGDIGEAGSTIGFLEMLGGRLGRPLHFVLGNHDYYRGSIGAVREAARALTHRSEWCRWLPEAGVVALGPQTALVGHGGWGDGRCGDFMASEIMLNDYVLIKDLLTGDKAERFERLKALGDEAASSLREHLESALVGASRAVLLTHVPPFREACWHEGENHLNEWTPHFTCGAVGQMLLDVMRQLPDKHLEVLCGHTHSSGEAQMLPNLIVRTGGAVYGAPAIGGILEVASSA